MKRANKAKQPLDQVHDLQERVNAYEREKNILLTLSNDITKVREKDDLMKIISSTLKGFFYFTTPVVFLVDRQKEVYFPFLLDAKTHPIKDPAIFKSVLASQYPFAEAYNRMLAVDSPTCYLLEEIMDKPGVPPVFKLNYEYGMREVMVTPLKRNMETFGYVLFYSDKTDSFPDDFKIVIQGIAPHLSNAVSNIIINEEIRYKEYVNEILLALSNDMVTVRSRTDLLNVINFGLKRLIYFTHSVMTVLDETGETYHAFLTDPDSRTKKFPEYAEMVSIPNPVRDGIYDVASASDKPVVFEVASVDLSNAPLWFRVNSQAGAKEILIKALPGEGMPKHSIFLFSDRPNNFDEKAIQIVERISSQLATAANNISANEELLTKEKEKSFLLEFSHAIAAMRTKNDLSLAIHSSLKKISEIKAYFVRVLNDDGSTMSPFMHDNDVFYKADPEFKKLLATKIPINVGITAKVMNGDRPVLIDFEEEISHGNTDHYIEFWKHLGPAKAAFQKMIGTPLRMGDKNFGILWVITPKINMTILEGISAQISVAISNVKSNEEIEKRQEEKSKLLSLSGEIAALRSRNDLLRVVNTKLKELFSIKEFGLAQIDEDRTTYSAFVFDLENATTSHADFEEVTAAKYSVNDKVFSSIMNSEDPVIFDVQKLAEAPGIPAYVGFWKRVGLRKVLGNALRVGGKNVGMAFLHIDTDRENTIKNNLVKAVCAQLSVAVSNILANEQVLTYKQMLEIENDQLKEQIKTIYNFSDIVGSGPAMQKVYQMMSLVADSNSTVLLLGETGTGKELIARAIHNSSPRKNKLMIKVNCAAMPANLIESELFGHEKGSFTGAIERRIGKFELANNSTLFLDEIGEMPIELQVKLLRAIQEREIERVGGKNPIKIDVRIVAATNRNLEEQVKAGRFRSDLYYRLNVFPIELPPLKDRIEDIEPLANFFLVRYAKNTGRKVTAISPNVMKDLKSYGWPGNVRELEHLIERSILLTHDSVLKEVRLPNKPQEERNENSDLAGKTLQQLERAYIIEILKRCNGKVAGKGGAAELLEIPSTTLHSKIKKLHILKRDYFSE